MNQIDKQDLPTREEKEKSIQFIMSQVATKPKSFPQFIHYIFREMDWRVCFYGLGDVFLIALSVMSSVFTLFFIFMENDVSKMMVLTPNFTDNTYFTVFLLAPVTYAILHYLSIWKEVQLKTFELKMTMKLSLKDIMIIRSLVFSLLSLVVSVLLSVMSWLTLDKEVSLLKLISLASVSILLFVIVQIHLDNKIPTSLAYIVSPIFWAIVGFLLILSANFISPFINQLPEMVVLLLGVLLLVYVVYLLRQNYLAKKEGGLSYVRN